MGIYNSDSQRSEWQGLYHVKIRKSTLDQRNRYKNPESTCGMFKVRGSQCGWNVVVKGKGKTKVSGREHQGPDYKGFGKAE